MKTFIERFKKIIRFLATIFASREFAFIYCLIGTGSQVAHTYFLTESISSFTGGFKIFQATLISFFISSSLLYFVAITNEADGEKEYKRNKLAVTIFMIIEILINFYYYARHLIIDSSQIQVFDFIFAVLVSCLIPVTIKLYANSIRAKEWIEEMSTTDKKQNNDISDADVFSMVEAIIEKRLSDLNIDKNSEIDVDEIKTIILDQFEKIEKEKLEDIDVKINKIFEKHKELFLQQIENKIKLMLKQQQEVNA